MNHSSLVKYLGLKWDKTDKRDFSAEAVLGGEKDLPSKVDLSVGHIYDQGSCGSCTAHAATNAHKVINYRQHGHVGLDPYKLWERQKETGASCDTGDYISDAVKELKEHGSETEDGEKYPIEQYVRIYDTTPKSFKKYLAQKYPVVIGLNVRDSENNTIWNSSDGMPTGEPGKKGWHAVILVGYDDDKRLFKIENSWGEWGDNGYCYLDYDYLSEYVYNSIYIIHDKKDMLYKDVSESAWYADAVQWVVGEGYMSVDDDNRFNPEEPINRAMMAQILYNLQEKWKL